MNLRCPFATVIAWSGPTAVELDETAKIAASTQQRTKVPTTTPLVINQDLRGIFPEKFR
jgi:hypothetical protein